MNVHQLPKAKAIPTYKNKIPRYIGFLEMEYIPVVCKELAGLIVIRVFFDLKNFNTAGKIQRRPMIINAIPGIKLIFFSKNAIGIEMYFWIRIENKNITT